MSLLLPSQEFFQGLKPAQEAATGTDQLASKSPLGNEDKNQRMQATRPTGFYHHNQQNEKMLLCSDTSHSLVTGTERPVEKDGENLVVWPECWDR